jgi:outer membrane protein TolC
MKAFAGSFILLFAFLCETATAQQLRSSNLSPNLFGSISQGAPTAGTMPLTIADAIDRALKYNLAGILSEQETRVSSAARVRALSELLPRVNAGVTETVQQINLAAFGFNSFPGVNSVVGPFSVFDARAGYSQSVLDFKLLHELRAASERVSASNYALQDVVSLLC